MINMKRFLCFMILCLPLIMHAQEEKGIKWTTGLSWEQIKQKAKAENKHIFLDVYATWCGPCKNMDKIVYVNDSVGNFFNEKFISVKVQVDKTKNDNEQVRNWYNDAALIAKQYYIEAFPTFLFISPNGTITEKEKGYRNPNQLMAIGEGAIQPGKRYDEIYAKYDSLMSDYRKGIVHYDQLPDMIKAATKIDTGSRAELMQLYKEHVSSLKPKDRYTKKNIEFWSSLSLSLNSPLFKFFLKDRKRIDKVMANDNYSADVKDKTIQSQIVTPFFVEQNTRKDIPMFGMILGGPGLKGDNTEADWKKLHQTIKEQFNNKIAKKNVLLAKIEWYLRHGNFKAYSESMLTRLEKYPSEPKTQGININTAAWYAFLHATDKEILNGYIKWMAKIVSLYHANEYFLDTYANLLYKVGRKDEAISWEEKAVQLKGRTEEACRATLYQMKKGEPTNGVQPLVAYK